MALISIIADDKMVVKDGVFADELKLTDLPADVWAVEWDTTTSKGHVEKRDLSVEQITSIETYQSCIDEYEAAVAAEIAAGAPNLKQDFIDDRNALLVDSDWTQMPDSPLTDAKKAEWATYRQALRDLPETTTDYSNVTFPTQPS